MLDKLKLVGIVLGSGRHSSAVVGVAHPSYEQAAGASLHMNKCRVGITSCELSLVVGVCAFVNAMNECRVGITSCEGGLHSTGAAVL